MEDYNECESTDLYHHGIKGQRWGVRRFQNKDGSLTDSGERRRRSLGQVVHDHKVKKKRVEALKKARETKAANKEAAEKAAKEAEKRQKLLEKGKLSPKKMTDEELNNAVNRKQAEQRYQQLDLATHTGKRFVSTMWNDSIVPGMVDGGKKLVSDMLFKKGSDLLGLSAPKAEKSEYQKLKESAEMAKWRKQQFQDERDLAEARRRYEDHLREEAQTRRNRSEQESTANRQREQDYDYEMNQRRSNNNYRRNNSANESSDDNRSASNSGQRATTALLEDRSSGPPSTEHARTGQAFVEDSATGQVLMETDYTEFD